MTPMIMISEMVFEKIGKGISPEASADLDLFR